MSLKNKALLNDFRSAGGFAKHVNWYNPCGQLSPEKFANSSDLRKISKRNKKHR